MPDQRSQLEQTFLSRLQPKVTPAAPAPEHGELAGRRRDPSLFLLSLDRIRPDADQVRLFGKAATDPAIRELADSIRSVGVLQPIDVRYVRDGDFYEIVAGERRYTAATLAGLTEIPVKVLDAPDSEVRRLQLLENIHREQLSPLELGTALLRLVEDGATPEDLSKLLSKTTSYVTKALGIARNLSAEAKRLIEEQPDRFQSMAHLYEVSLLQPQEQRSVLLRVANEGLTREQLRQVTADIKQVQPQADAPRASRGGRPSKGTYFTKTIPLEVATVTIRLRKADATREDIIAVLRHAMEALD